METFDVLLLSQSNPNYMYYMYEQIKQIVGNLLGNIFNFYLLTYYIFMFNNRSFFLKFNPNISLKLLIHVIISGGLLQWNLNLTKG